jgi:hypothetical protein
MMFNKRIVFVSAFVLLLSADLVLAYRDYFNGYGQEYGRGVSGFDGRRPSYNSRQRPRDRPRDRPRPSYREEESDISHGEQGETNYGPIGKFGKFIGGLITGKRH